MTSQEKEAINTIYTICSTEEGASVLLIAEKLGLSIDSAKMLCESLKNKGCLESLSPERCTNSWYKITTKAKEELKEQGIIPSIPTISTVNDLYELKEEKERLKKEKNSIKTKKKVGKRKKTLKSLKSLNNGLIKIFEKQGLGNIEDMATIGAKRIQEIG